MTVEQLQRALNALDDGVLQHGSHNPGRAFCALEFESQVRGRVWSDDPVSLPDLRSLNDGPWLSDQERTDALLPVMSALWDWSRWSSTQRQAWTAYVVIKTVNRIISQLPGLSDVVRKQCRRAHDLRAAAEAAEAARQETTGASDTAAAEAAAAAKAAAAGASGRAAWMAGTTVGVARTEAIALVGRAVSHAAEEVKHSVLQITCAICIAGAKLK